MRRTLSLAAAAACIVLAAFLALLLLGPGSRADVAANGTPDATMDQASYTAVVGGTFHVKITVTGLGAANCSRYQFSVPYEAFVNIVASTPDVATGCVNGMHKNEFTWDWAPPPPHRAGVGCGLAGVPSSPPFTDSQQVVDYTFHCLSEGSGTIALGDIALADGAGNYMYGTTRYAPVHCAAASGLCGDVNATNGATMIDAMLIAQCVAGLTDCGSLDPWAADVNCSGGSGGTMLDAMLIAQKVAGLVPDLGCCGIITESDALSIRR